MTTFTDHGLVCLGEDEYAALPLAVRADAQAVVDTTSELDASLTAYNNRPWLMVTSTVAVTGAQSLSNPTYSGNWPGFQVMQTYTSTATAQGFGLSHFRSPASAPPAGWYHVGGWATFQATGAVNNFTQRLLAVQWFHTEQSVNITENVIQSCYESNTGGDALTVQGMFYANGVNIYTPTLMFLHRNSSSTMQVNVGAKLWITYLGSGLAV